MLVIGARINAKKRRAEVARGDAAGYAPTTGSTAQVDALAGDGRAAEGERPGQVEHPFIVNRNLFRHRKTRYKGLAKNEAQLFSLFELANLVIAKKSLLIAHVRGAS